MHWVYDVRGKFREHSKKAVELQLLSSAPPADLLLLEYSNFLLVS